MATDYSIPKDEYKALVAENAKLRERIHELEMEGSDHFYRTAYAEDANRTLEAENAKLRELVRDLWLTGSLCDAIPDMRLQAKGGDWRTMQERVDEALGIEVDA